MLLQTSSAVFSLPAVVAFRSSSHHKHSLWVSFEQRVEIFTALPRLCFPWDSAGNLCLFLSSHITSLCCSLTLRGWVSTEMIHVTMWNCDFSEQITNFTVNNSNALDKTLDQFMLFIVSHSQPFTKKSFPFSGVIHHLFCVHMNRNLALLSTVSLQRH